MAYPERSDVPDPFFRGVTVSRDKRVCGNMIQGRPLKKSEILLAKTKGFL